MLVRPVNHELLAKHEAEALARNVDVLQRVEPDVTVPNGTWTAHDVGSHLVGMIGRYLNADGQRAASANDVAVINQQEISEFESSTMGELVGRLRSRNAKYNAFWPELPLDALFPLRGGLPLDVACLRTNWISELLIHGRDVALAVGEDWPLDDQSCLLTLRLLANVLHTYVRPDGLGDGTLVIAPAGGAPFSLVIRGGNADIHAAAEEGADMLSGSPAALALLLYGRIGLGEAEQMGAYVSGDADGVQRFLDRLEKP
jgi:uncharacterized protein (TIGR03083 family)